MKHTAGVIHCCGNCARTLQEKEQLTCYALPAQIFIDEDGEPYTIRGVAVESHDPICIHYLLRTNA